MKKTNTIARIENSLIFDSKYHLSAKEQKVILLLISKVDPIKQKNLYIQLISYKEMQNILMTKKNGSFKADFQKLARRLLKKELSFKTGFVVNGESIDGYMSWFQYISPKQMDDGSWGMEFMFSERLEPFLLDLKQYVKIDYLEVLPLNSGFAVRMFQIFKALRYKMSKHQKTSSLSYEVDELKELLGIADLYKDFRNFKRRVLIPIEREINKDTSLKVKMIPIKEGRSIVKIKFVISDKGTATSTQVSGKKNYDSLSFAELKAYNRLVSYGVTEGIVLQMLQKAIGSEIKGFEDWYFFEVIRIFETKTKEEDSAAKAGVLVNWFLKKKVFEQGDMFAKIMEALQARKKRLQNDNPTSWDNRQMAKGMSAEAFRKQFKKQ